MARALKSLDLNVNWIGGSKQPPKSTDDEDILGWVRRTNQVVVTTNHDMVVLCAEAGETVIWLDPRDRDISLEALTLMCFEQVAEWERALEGASRAVCIVARKTTYEVMDLGRAKRIAIERGKRRRREVRRRAAAASDAETLFDEGAPTT